MSRISKLAIGLAGALVLSAAFVMVSRSQLPASHSAAPTRLTAKATAKPLFRVNELATLLVQNRSGIGLDADSQFFLRGFTPDGAQLLVERDEVSEREVYDGAYELNIFLDTVNLNDGNIKSLLQNQPNIDMRFGDTGPAAAPLAYSDATMKDENAPWLFFEPLDKKPPTDTNVTLNPGALSGSAVYVDDIRLSGTGDNTQWGTFVSLLRFGEGTVRQGQTFPTESNGFSVFGPQWSPDGKTVLLKVGSQGDEASTYSIYLWNPQLGRIKRGPREQISYLQPRWSPDSARIAYLTGGDPNGNNGFLTSQPTNLCVYDVAKRRSRTLVTNVSSAQLSLAQFQWRDAKSLLYAAWIPTLLRTQRGFVPSVIGRSTYPSIWEISVTGGISKLVIEAGIFPIPSPDQRWIAFFGWPTDNDKLPVSSKPRLFLWNRQTQRRILVQPEVFRDGAQMMWTPDSRNLILLQSSYKASVAQGVGRLGAVSVE